MNQKTNNTPAFDHFYDNKTSLWKRLLPWVITAGCFAYLYSRLEHAASVEGTQLVPYLTGIFAHVNWGKWLALMVPYCFLFLLTDTIVVWRVVNWFNVKIRFADVFPIRASAYILSIVNEQVSKGAIAFYLNRRYGIPGWEVGSSMLFIMFCEYYYLLTFATIGVLLQWTRFPKAFHAIPWIAFGSTVFFVLFHLFFSGSIGAGISFREKPIFRTFRMAKVWHYAAVIALRSPLIVGAAMTYTLALHFFGVTVSFGEMLGYLPVIFFGAATPGPMHSVAILFWVLLFPDKPGEMTAFGFVQHNFFIFFNAGIGLIFLRRASRELLKKTA